MKHVKIFHILGLLIFGALIAFFVIQDSNIPSNEETIKEILGEKGYEVTEVGFSDVDAYIKMNAFGERSEQVRIALIDLAVFYPSAQKYKVQVSSSAKDCYYEIKGDIYRNYLSNLKVESNESVRNYLLIDKELGDSENCY